MKQETMKESIIEVKNFSAWYGVSQVLKDVDLDIYKNEVTAIIGPSGCGKSTLIRCFNRMNEFIQNFRFEGTMLYEGKNIYEGSINPIEIRIKIGMVFQKQNPFPKSIYDNVTYGPKLLGERNRVILDGIVEETLKKAALWDEVKDKLKSSALALSGGQQQRLCIARALAVNPEIVLMDEPASALDPISTAKIEELIHALKENYTIIIVTHNMQQAARVSDRTAFFYMGELVEYNETKKIFMSPDKKQTEEYITGRFG